jgi:single-strand DNA-binding protein
MEQIKGTVNRVELVGWIGAEPEQRFLPSGTAVCNFRVATKRWAGRNEDGNRSVETDWTPVEAWDKLAEMCARYIHKGSRVRVIGSLHTRSWEDRESGQKRFKTIVRADEVLFLDTRPGTPDATEEVEEIAEVAEALPF